jgi:hypothetical protein
MIRPANFTWRPLNLLSQCYWVALVALLLPLCYLLMLAETRDDEFMGPAALLLFPPIALLAIWRTSGIVLLVTVQLFTLVQSTEESNTLWLLHLMLVTCCLLGVAMLYRLGLLWQVRGPVTLLEFFHMLAATMSSAIAAAPSQRFVPFRSFIRQLLLLALQVSACVITAGLLFAFTRTDEQSDALVGLLPKELHAIVLGTLLTLIFIATSTLFGYWRWRQLSRAQASVYSRSYYAGWLAADLRLFAQREQRLQPAQDSTDKRRWLWRRSNPKKNTR